MCVSVCLRVCLSIHSVFSRDGRTLVVTVLFLVLVASSGLKRICPVCFHSLVGSEMVPGTHTFGQKTEEVTGQAALL